MDSLQDLALAAIVEISRQIHELLEDGPGNGRLFYITLTIRFEGVQRWLESPCHETNFDRHVWKLLRILNQLVQVRKHGHRPTYPRLTRNIFHPSVTDIMHRIQWPTGPPPIAYDSQRTDHSRTFPWLRRLAKKKAQSKENIRSLATAGKKKAIKTRSKIQESLERLAQLKSVSGTGGTFLDDSQRLLEEERKNEDSRHTKLNDLRSHIQLLHSSLAQHCICGFANERNPITANLRLNCHDGSTEAQLEDQSINFSLLFLSHPHSILSAEAHQSQWRDTQICVYRRR